MQSTEVFLRAVQNTTAKFSHGERSNQIKHTDSKHTLPLRRAGWVDEWMSVALGYMKILRRTESSILHSHYYQNPIPESMLYAK